MWQDLVKVALLGTENSRISDRTLQALQAQGIDIQQEQATVLAQGAALLAQMKKAGFRLETFEGELPKPVETSGENYLSPKSARHLEMMLNGRFEAVLPEFMALALENKKSLPPESLPTMLNRPKAEALLEKMLPAIGEGGRWLLAQNPVWQQFIDDPADFDWHTSSKTERLALLRHLRKTDPAHSFVLLQATWETESPTDKTDFLNALWTGLSSQDEPFLEACLDDRRKEVREIAAKLLVKIPGSQLSERMWRRATACLEFVGDELKTNLVGEVKASAIQGLAASLLAEIPGSNLPESIWRRAATALKWGGKELKINVVGEGDAGAIRDGILSKHPNWQGGAKAVFLGQVVSLVAPERWEAFFQKTPAEILTLFQQSDWQQTLLQAVREAVLFFERESWLEALLTIWLKNQGGFSFNPTLKQLIEMTPAAMANKLALSVLQAQQGLPEADSPVFRLLQHNSQPWENELSTLIINRFQVWLNTNQRHDWQMIYLKDLLKLAALRSNPNLHDTLQKGWNPNAPTWSFWEKSVEEMLNTLLFRKEMKAELER